MRKFKFVCVAFILIFGISGCNRDTKHETLTSISSSSQPISADSSNSSQAQSSSDANFSIEKYIGFEESDNLSQIHFNSAFFTDSGTYFGFASASEGNAYVTLYEDEERKYICYRFSLDGKKEKIGDSIWNYLLYKGNSYWMYWEDNVDSMSSFEMSIGGKKKSIYDASIPSFGKSGIYFITDKDEDVLYHMDYSGKSKTILTIPEGIPDAPIEYDGYLWIFLNWDKKSNTRTDSPRLYRLNLDGSNPVEILRENYKLSGIRNHCIYLCNYEGTDGDITLESIKRYNIQTGELITLPLPSELLSELRSINFTNNYCFIFTTEGELYRTDKTFHTPEKITDINDFRIERFVVSDNRIFIEHSNGEVHGVISEIDEDGKILRTFK